eukprot:CAMPEP_0168292722 /NCGR_PEP_ID=MMETSP0142_2-20121227/7339_1 /TAXON_ID=44445 /ORGANISM="Pseudo-nitzschia australis, Strain 10249 10 AB" /LENGTH=711 /DNA_ID=CAMNT_0008240607 /DNA_START=55 /DNA_END=2190 /DNA_ORIENTATION=+
MEYSRQQINCAISSWDETSSHWEIAKQSRSAIAMIDCDSKCTASTADDSYSYDYWSSSSYSSLPPSSRKRKRKSIPEKDSIPTTTTTYTSRNRERTRREDTHEICTASFQKAQQIEKDAIQRRMVPKNLKDHCKKDEGSYWTEPTSKRRRKTKTSRYVYFVASSSMTNKEATASVDLFPKHIKSVGEDDEVFTGSTKKLSHEKYNKRVKKVYFLDQLGESLEMGIDWTAPTIKVPHLIVNKDQTKETASENNAWNAFPDVLTISSSCSKVTNTDNVMIKINGKRGKHSTWFWIDTDSMIEESSTSCNSSEDTSDHGTVRTNATTNDDEETNLTKILFDENNALDVKHTVSAVSTSGIEEYSTSSISNDSQSKGKCKINVGALNPDGKTNNDDGTSLTNIHVDDSNNTPNAKNTVAVSSTGGGIKTLRDHCRAGIYWIEPTERRRSCCNSFSDGATGEKISRASKSKTSAKTIGSVNCEHDSKIYFNSAVNIDKEAKRGKECDERRWQSAEKRDVVIACTDRLSAKTINNSENIVHVDNTETIDTKARMNIHYSNEKVRNNPTGSTEFVTREIKRRATNSTTRRPTPTATKANKKKKIIYEATDGSNRPDYKYALDLISLVCNNSYVIHNSARCSQERDGSTRHYCQCQQFHRILDNPPFDYALDAESDKERLMRLQLRQRFASATSAGMSPIEFSRKLLNLWGATLEEHVL